MAKNTKLIPKCDCIKYQNNYVWVTNNTQMQPHVEGYYDCTCLLCGRKFEYRG